MGKKKKLLIVLIIVLIVGVAAVSAWSIGKRESSNNQQTQVSDSATPSSVPQKTSDTEKILSPNETKEELDSTKKEGLESLVQAGQITSPEEREQAMRKAAEKLLGKDFKLEKFTDEKQQVLQEELAALNKEHTSLLEQYEKLGDEKEKERMKQEIDKVERKQMEYIVQIMYNVL